MPGRMVCAHEHGHIGQVGDEFPHQREVLRAVVLGRHVDLQERDIDIAQVIVVALVRVADEQFALRVVMFLTVFQGSAHQATSNNSNVNHLFVNILICYFPLSPIYIRESKRSSQLLSGLSLSKL